jgi:pimeloyl-ACP methyl ester carboxylesterase
MATALLNGVQLYYDEMGSGECIVLTHGSWIDATSWQAAANLLAQRYRVVTWDRRGHSRSRTGDPPGSRAEDALDMAALIEHVSSAPVHVVGNSYGASIALTLITRRPDLVLSAAVHEPPLFELLRDPSTPALQRQLATVAAELAAVRDLITSGRSRAAAAYFVDHVALGAGAWQQLPPTTQAIFERNASTFLDELDDDTALTIEADALASITAPVLLTHGTESPALFPAVVTELQRLFPAHIGVLHGAGHVPHMTHTEQWVAQLHAFTNGSRSTGVLAP